MASGTALVLTGALLRRGIAGQTPDTSDYDDLATYESDLDSFNRQSMAGNLVAGVGLLGLTASTVSFIIGGGIYLHGKKRSERAGVTGLSLQRGGLTLRGRF